MVKEKVAKPTFPITNFVLPSTGCTNVLTDAILPLFNSVYEVFRETAYRDCFTFCFDDFNNVIILTDHAGPLMEVMQQHVKFSLKIDVDHATWQHVVLFNNRVVYLLSNETLVPNEMPRVAYFTDLRSTLAKFLKEHQRTAPSIEVTLFNMERIANEKKRRK